MSSDDLHISGRIRLKRHELQLPITYLAARLGVSTQQITNYETGFHRISAGRLFRVAVALGTPIEWFYEALPPDQLGSSPLPGERRRWEHRKPKAPAT